jgi:cell division protein FtsL
MEIYQIVLMVIGAISIIVANHNNKTAIVMQDSASEENKILLRKYLDHTR